MESVHCPWLPRGRQWRRSAGIERSHERACKVVFGAGLQPCSPPSVLSKLAVPKNVRGEEGCFAGENYFRRPPAVDSSPVQMHCRLVLDVPLLPTTTNHDHCSDTPKKDNNHDKGERQENIPSMLLLQIDTFVIKGCALRSQTNLHPGKTTTHGNPDVRSITAKIDCLLLRPLASLGNGRFGRVGCIYHMARPRPLFRGKCTSCFQNGIHRCMPEGNGTCTDIEGELEEETCNNMNWESNSMWEIDGIAPVDSINKMNFSKEGDGDVTYTYCIDDCCPLGYNPMKQVVCPRFIGWISTYEPNSLACDDTRSDNTKGTEPIPHISSYSFFVDVARGSRPMVAFAACTRTDEFANADDDSADNNGDINKSSYWKDAQRDAEHTGVFCVNIVSEELAWAMNASAAPLGKGLSEFRLMEGGGSCTNASSEGTQSRQRTVPTPVRAPNIDAPYVPQSPMFMECRYVKTVKIPVIFKNDSMFSLIVGEVINVHIRKDCLEPERHDVSIDLKKARPVARLGYGQEYTVVLKHAK